MAPPGESGVYEGQGDDGDAQAWRFGEDAEGVGVADAVGPFVDCVVGRGATMIASAGGDLGSPGLRLFAAHCAAGLGFELGPVNERHREDPAVMDDQGASGVPFAGHVVARFAGGSEPVQAAGVEGIFAGRR